MFRDLPDLLWPGGHPPQLDRRRAEAILARVHAFSMIFAVLTLAFITTDAAFLPEAQWHPLAAARIISALAFIALGLWSHQGPPTLTRAIPATLVLFAIPAAFAVFAHDMLHGAPGQEASHFLAAAYSFVPFLLACGVAAFPLTAIEAIGLSSLAFVDQTWFLYRHDHGDTPLLSADAFWLLFLVASISTYAASTQVKLLTALVKQMIRDPLTGCLRRESGQELLEMQMALSARQGTPLTIMFADLDRFKEVNDAFGHDAGDHVLATAAASLRRALRESDALLRWGGEEFVVMLPGTASADAVKLLERLRQHGVARMPDGRAMTVSVGIAERIQDKADDVERLVEIADRRMYEAKESGRNRYVAPGAAPTPLLA